MTERDFCYWLQGYFELAAPTAMILDAGRQACIRKHVALVEASF